MQYAELTYVKETATGTGLNTQIVMEQLNEDTARITQGRVGIRVGVNKPHSWTIPMSDWDKFLSDKQQRGYMLTATQKASTRRTAAAPALSPDPVVNRLLTELKFSAAQAVAENFTVKPENVSEEMLAAGKKVFEDLVDSYEGLSVSAFNIKLKMLFSMIPRRIDRLSAALAKTKSDFVDILAREQDLLALIGQAATDIVVKALPFNIVPVSEKEEEMIKQKMGSQAHRYVEAFKVVNAGTQKRFDAFTAAYGLSAENGGISLLWHGSRTENWWSILNTGLTINPKGVVVTGKAYGYGTYFAPDAVKSLGYTSCQGSRWANGTAATAFMGLYNVATGTQERRFDGRGGANHNLNWANLQAIQPGALCTWAESRWSGFCMDEVIVYQDCQDTIGHLVRVSC